MRALTLPPETVLFGGGRERPGRDRSGHLTLWFHTVVFWRERAKQRRALLELDARLLRDIGVTRAQAIIEARKPFWKP